MPATAASRLKPRRNHALKAMKAQARGNTNVGTCMMKMCASALKPEPQTPQPRAKSPRPHPKTTDALRSLRCAMAASSVNMST